MARLSTEARGALASVAVLGLLAAGCSSSAAPDRGASRSPIRPAAASSLGPHTDGKVIHVAASYNNERQLIPPGHNRIVIVTFTQQEKRQAASGQVTVEDELTGKNYAVAVRPPQQGLEQTVKVPDSAGQIQSLTVVRG